MKVKIIKENSSYYNQILDVEKRGGFYFHPETLSIYNLYECVNWEDEQDLPKPCKEETLKFDEGKPDFTLIPQEALLELAKVFTHGANKYGKHNYSLGTDYSRYIAAAHRHINQWLRGEDIDEIGTNHLANAAASLLMVLDNQKTNKGTDDRNKVYKR